MTTAITKAILAILASIIAITGSSEPVPEIKPAEQETVLLETKEQETEPEEQMPWYTEEEFKLLCQLVMAEGGADIIPDEAQQGIAAVIINRTRYPQHFGSTIEEVIFRPGQYSCSSYVRTEVPTERVIENVRKVMDGEVVIPKDVVWQSGSPQCAWGTQVSIYAYYDTSPHDIYLCHWGK